ncbi:MAG: hypothetical protein K8W52_08310 [Deltaproteobacteria bacterium]|nr:hypothetical protein [Deltaproteobacteria bacterium]
MIANPNIRLVRGADRQGRETVIAVESPVKGSGLRRWNLVAQHATDVALLEAALPVIHGASKAERLSADVRARLRELGVLVNRNEVSAPSRMRCPLEAPPEGARATDDDLVVAASVHFDRNCPVPSTLARELVLDGLDLSGPTVWVEDPVTRVVFPYRVPARWVAALERTLDGRPAAALPAEARAAFHAAGILVSAVERRAHAKRAAWLNGRGRELLTTQLTTTPFPLGIPPLQLRALQHHYRVLDAEGWFGHAKHAHGRSMIHDEPASVFLQRQLLPLLTALTEKPWRTTGCYLGIYRPGSELEPHTDGGQGGLTMSLQIELTPAVPRARAWPLAIELPANRGRRRVLQARMLDGEFVTFHGTDLRHWRGPLRQDARGTFLFMNFVEA